ncbi:MAG: glycosyl transferase, partial [Candidatus Ratteibacteria bacterium]
MIRKKLTGWFLNLKSSRCIPDEQYLARKYKKRIGKRLNLQNPRAFTEKVQWLKLNWRDDTLTRCADKYEVRKFVETRVGPELLKKLYGV